jgi:hypothetical protein
MYQLIFSRRKRGFMTTTSQQAVLMHLLKQSTVTDRADVVDEDVNVVNEFDNDHFSRRLLEKFQQIRVVEQIQNR